MDGFTSKQVDLTVQEIHPWGAEPWPPCTMYFRMDGLAVLEKHGGVSCPSGGLWDTLYYLGDIGDRWNGDNVDPACYPLGVLEIQDTGHVVIQGTTLRTWDIAYLDENGAPLPFSPDTFRLTERLGMTFNWPPQPCDGGIVEGTPGVRLHYSDIDFSIPDGSTCDLPTMVSGTEGPPLTIAPNPGTDQLWITGLTATASIEVRDPLGRLVHSRSKLPMNAPIETASWESGTYFITVVQANGARDLLRWVKQ